MDGRVSSRMNSAIPHRAGKDCALCAAHEKAAERHRTASPARRSRFIPWMVALSLVVVLLPFGDWSRLIALGSETPMMEEPAILPTTEELVVPLTWRVFEDNMLTWLRFESAGILPSQIRIMNENQSVIAISARALDTIGEGEQTALVVRAPDDVVAALEGRHTANFVFEALVDDSWCKVELAKSNRNATTDKRGRVWRPEDDHRSQALIA